MTAVKRPSKALIVCRHILGSRWFVSILAVLIAFAIGAILIAMTGASVLDAYYAMFRGAIFDPSARSFQRQIKPLAWALPWASARACSTSVVMARSSLVLLPLFGLASQ